MTGLVDWAGSRARMIIAFIALTLIAGSFAYVSLPKEGEPDIEIPGLYVSVPFPGISAEDAEKLLVKPMETKLSDLDGLDSMSATASEGYGGIWLEFEFGWDKTKIIADVRDRMGQVEAEFPEGADSYQIIEVNFSEFPILIVNLTGPVPERSLVTYAKRMQDRIEALEPVLEAPLTGQRDEMLEVVIDPLRLEAYNVTAGELISVVTNNNQLVAAGEIDTDQGTFAVKIPSSFDTQADVMALPVKVNGDRVVTLGDLADVRLTFEDRAGTARFNGESTVALQVVKRKGYPIIDTVELIKTEVQAEYDSWPEELRNAIVVGTSNDQSKQVSSMVDQLENSVLTAIALVMIVVLASLGIRSALLVGFAIPTSFLLCFILLGLLDVTISNIVMFGLILAVGMLVDGAIVVVEYAERRISEGTAPMAASLEAAKRMFWPIVSSTATTLCAFLPMLFWPGVAGEFMGLLPVTIIFVLSASLIVALIYLPVVGGITGRMALSLEQAADYLHDHQAAVPRLLMAALVLVGLGASLMGLLHGNLLIGGIGFVLFACLSFVTLSSFHLTRSHGKVHAGYRRSSFGHTIAFITGHPLAALGAVVAVIIGVVTVFSLYMDNNKGVEFFSATEPEQAIIYVRARGNLSIAEQDALVRQAETIVLNQKGVDNAFAFAGDGGLNSNTGGSSAPRDTIGQIQVELIPWEDRPQETTDGFLFFKNTHVQPEFNGNYILDQIEEKLARLPGIYTETLNLSMGPASAKPVHLRLKGDDWDKLIEATETVHAKFGDTLGLSDVEDTRPLPGIDWQIDVDVAKAGRFGANVATVGGMIQLVTRGILLDTMRVPSSDEEIEIRVRLPEQDRVLSTLDTLKVRTNDGLVPLSNFITRKPVAKLAQIDRVDQTRYFDVKAAVIPDLSREDGTAITATERIATLTDWLETDQPLPQGVSWEWTGDEEEQAESQAFLGKAFGAALALMFIILLAQFNSFYNAALVLLAVVLSTTGVLVGLMVMDLTFGIIMTGTGIVALAGIVVNNNIVLIDTYQDYARYMPQLEAIVRTVEDRIRPVILTTVTTMAGLTPMMFALSLDFIDGGYTLNAPTAQFWTNLATAVVFGLGIATLLTLVFTPAMLALRVWFWRALHVLFTRLIMGKSNRIAADYKLRREAQRLLNPEFIWSTGPQAWGAPADFDARRASSADLSQTPAPAAARRPAPAKRPIEQPPGTAENMTDFSDVSPDQPGKKG